MLVLVGSNHRSAPVEIRERMSFPLERLEEAHAKMILVEGVSEGMILSTCNRVEILARAADSGPGALEGLKRFLAEQHKLSLQEIDRYTYQLVGNDAVKHLFSVASGLDSMIMGEPQILGQVKQAFHTAREHRTVGPLLERLLQHCLATAKKVRTETGISRNAVSVAFAAIELARRIFGHLEGRSALLIGAGKMGGLVGRHLISNGVGQLRVCSRTYTHAVVHAERLGGRAVSWEEGLRQLRDVDIVVSCTGASRRVLSKADVGLAIRGRRKGPLFLIDIAVPRDIDPEVNELDNVYLYDIDGLQGVVDSNLEERRLSAERAKRMIAKEVSAFDRWQQVREVTPVIVSLRESLLGIGRNELQRFRGRLGPLDERQEKAVEELTRAVIQKILHRPIRHLKTSVERGDTADCALIYREIFGVDVGDPARFQPGPPGGDGDDGEGDARPGPRRVIEGGKDG